MARSRSTACSSMHGGHGGERAVQFPSQSHSNTILCFNISFHHTQFMQIDKVAHIYFYVKQMQPI